MIGKKKKEFFFFLMISFLFTRGNCDVKPLIRFFNNMLFFCNLLPFDYRGFNIAEKYVNGFRWIKINCELIVIFFLAQFFGGFFFFFFFFNSFVWYENGFFFLLERIYVISARGINLRPDTQSLCPRVASLSIV